MTAAICSTKRVKKETTSTQSVAWPLSITSGKYFSDSFGVPFLIHGDSAWSILGQLTTSQNIATGGERIIVLD